MSRSRARTTAAKGPHGRPSSPQPRASPKSRLPRVVRSTPSLSAKDELDASVTSTIFTSGPAEDDRGDQARQERVDEERAAPTSAPAARARRRVATGQRVWAEIHADASYEVHPSMRAARTRHPAAPTFDRGPDYLP